MKENYPRIKMIFIPANCTSVCQPADVIINKSLKHLIRQLFLKYVAEVVAKQLAAGVAPADVKVDLRMTTLKRQLATWLDIAYKRR